MSFKVLTGQYMHSDARVTGPRRSWFPRILAESYLESTKDGAMKLSPDPVVMIDGTLSWFNGTGDTQDVVLLVIRAPRTVVVQSPATVIIHDSWSVAVGDEPTAEYPSVTFDQFGGRMAIDRASTAAKQLKFGRLFLFGDNSQAYSPVGPVEAGKSLEVRYIASVQTPGVWIVPTEFDPRWEANSYWARLMVLGAPSESRIGDETEEEEAGQ